MATLARLQQVDLRSVWTNEASSFTPWLAKQENLALLSEAIGISLVLESQEKSVGPFRADILCKSAGSERWVLIENQIERTDHTHLGQLLTYAAGLSAVTIVWVAQRFTDEHRAALDWLNEATHEDIEFFGLEIELWKIADSPAAPKFNVVSKPNAFVKRQIAERSHHSERSEFYIEYWDAFRTYCKDSGSKLNPTRSNSHWMGMSVGKSVYTVRAAAGKRDRYVSCDFAILQDQDKEIFRALEQHKSEILAKIPDAKWLEKSGMKESAILLEWRGADPGDQTQWPKQHKWLVENLELIYSTICPIAMSI